MIPLIDISLERQTAAEQIHAACRQHGFFYITGHGLGEPTQLEELSHQFFALPLEQKMQIRMELGGSAWRGYFPVGAELTSGRPDSKEGLYFGSELPDHDPRPLHGKNLFPQEPAGLKNAVLDYIDNLTRIGHLLMEAIALSLGLPKSFFAERYTAEPLTLFRIFHYPSSANHWGVGEHTDYGVLTILHQDQIGGLQVKTPSGWIDAPPIPGSLVCNIGDMLDKMTGGYYRSTPHRVLNQSGRSRLSFPFFFDPNFDARIQPIGSQVHEDQTERWDNASPHQFSGTYGDYILAKVAKVFPQLRAC